MHIYLCYITFNTWVLSLKYFPPLPICIVYNLFFEGAGHRVSLCISVDCPGTCCIDQASSSSGSSASASWVLTLKACRHTRLCPTILMDSVASISRWPCTLKFVWLFIHLAGCLLFVCWFGGGCLCCTCGVQRTARRSWLSAHQVSPRDPTQFRCLDSARLGAKRSYQRRQSAVPYQCFHSSLEWLTFFSRLISFTLLLPVINLPTLQHSVIFLFDSIFSFLVYLFIGYLKIFPNFLTSLELKTI